jgi:uncharacterized membrane protein
VDKSTVSCDVVGTNVVAFVVGSVMMVVCGSDDSFVDVDCLHQKVEMICSGLKNLFLFSPFLICY